MKLSIFLLNVLGNSFNDFSRLSDVSVNLYDRKRRLVEGDMTFSSYKEVQSSEELVSLLNSINNDTIAEIEINMLENGFVIHYNNRANVFFFK